MVNVNEKPIGIIGVGTMGGAICRRLMKNGCELIVHDSDTSRLREAVADGAAPATSPAVLAQSCNVVLVVVENDSQVREAIAGSQGLLSKLREGTTVIIHSTVTPETCSYSASLLETQGGELLDAAMSGGQVGIDMGSLTLMVGGKPGLLDNCRTLFGMYSDKILLMGDVGMGMAAKLCNNAILQANRLALYEAIRLAQMAGIDAPSFVDLVKVSSGRSWVTERWEELDYLVLNDGIDNLSMIRQMEKDLGLVFELSKSLGISMKTVELASEKLPGLMRSGLFSGPQSQTRS